MTSDQKKAFFALGFFEYVNILGWQECVLVSHLRCGLIPKNKNRTKKVYFLFSNFSLSSEGIRWGGGGEVQKHL